MVFEADLIFPFGNCVGVEVQGAGTQRVDAVHRIEDHFLDVDRGIRTEIGRTVTDPSAGRYDSRKGFVADDDPRVGLVVFEQNVVSGLEAFDQAVFEQEGFIFGSDYGMAQVGYSGNHDPHLGTYVRF